MYSINSPEAHDKALLARRAAKIAALNSNVRLDWPDDEHWKRLASEHGIQLPNKTTLCTSGGIVRYLHKLGKDGNWFRWWTGYSFDEWIEANARWSLRALVGIMLEEINSEDSSVAAYTNH